MSSPRFRCAYSRALHCAQRRCRGLWCRARWSALQAEAPRASSTMPAQRSSCLADARSRRSPGAPAARRKPERRHQPVRLVLRSGVWILRCVATVPKGQEERRASAPPRARRSSPLRPRHGDVLPRLLRRQALGRSRCPSVRPPRAGRRRDGVPPLSRPRYAARCASERTAGIRGAPARSCPRSARRFP